MCLRTERLTESVRLEVKRFFNYDKKTSLVDQEVFWRRHSWAWAWVWFRLMFVVQMQDIEERVLNKHMK